MGKLIDGKVIAKKIEQKTAKHVALLKKQGLTPKLAVILVGTDLPSQTYVRKKGQAAISVGMDFKLYELPGNITEIELFLNNNKIAAKSSAKDPVAANKLRRGLTSPLWYGDEWAFTKYNGIIHSSAVPALSTASDFAKSNNKPFGRTIN
jgi:hypothetical protein